jgi:arabinose-5-phosphate isomerase
MSFKKNTIENINYYFDNVTQTEDLANILIDNSNNNINIIGVGKSENIGLQLNDMLRCINFKSVLLPSSKILHGDIGFIHKNDIVLIISNSGNTQELIDICINIKCYKTENIYLLSSKENGKISKYVKDNIIIPVKNEIESCFSKIPTSSFINFGIFSNHLISLLIKKLNLKDDIYKINHSSGHIGKSYSNVSNYIIPKEKCSILNVNQSIKELILSQNKLKIGCSIIYNDEKIEGLVTDRDIRIFLEKNNNLDLEIINIMNKNFYFLKEDTQIKFIDNEFNYIPLIINGKLKGVYFKGLI